MIKSEVLAVPAGGTPPIKGVKNSFSKNFAHVIIYGVATSVVPLLYEVQRAIEGVPLVVGGERRLNSFYATCFFKEV